MKFYFRWGIDLSAIKRRWSYIKLCFISLTYNTHSSASEVLFEPIVTVVDFVARWFGIAFVGLVTVLVTYVVAIFYMTAIPHLQETYSPPRAYATIAYGHYLLVMIVFHYYKGVRTHPGRPPKDASERAVTSVCKKCILAKPPRTHHCSVCRNCVLKMDHHCPWLNNCVGHFNHRYFISFCIFMWLGTFFVINTTWPLFHDCFNVPAKWKYSVDSVYSFIGKSTSEGDNAEIESPHRGEMKRHALSSPDDDAYRQQKFELFSHEVPPVEDNRVELAMPNLCTGKTSTYRTNVVFLWLLCMGVTMALGALTAIQFRLISRGETSIEKLINDKERRKAAKNGIKFQNPYHLGIVGNWKILLGFHDFKSFVRKVLLPNAGLPIGDGLVWDEYISKQYRDGQMLQNY